MAWLQPMHRQGVQRDMRCWDVGACLGSPAIIIMLWHMVGLHNMAENGPEA